MLPVVLLGLVAAMRPRIAVDGVPDMDLPPNKDIEIPGYVKRFTDDDFYKTLKGNDVVVVMMREAHCPDCDFYAEYFYNATAKVEGVEGVVVGQIDIHEEGEIFMEHHGVEEDIPAVLVFKSEDVIRWRKKPVQFVVNTRLPDDLPPFVMRLLGPSYREISTNAELEDFLSQSRDHADNLCFLLTHPDPTPSKFTITLATRISEIERYNTFIAVRFVENSEGPTLTSYDLNTVPSTVASMSLPTKGDFRATVKNALQWMHNEKTKRAGHRYDNMVSYFQEDLEVPSNHSAVEKITNDKKRYVQAKVTGRSSHTRTVVLSREIEFVTQENQTMAGIERGVVGMSVGMTRVLVLPPEWREGWKHGPIDLHEASQLLLEVKVTHIGDTNELPGRIEWETDPVKIEEHRQKVIDDERKRAEAIERGEDPDAQCEGN